MTGLIQRTVFIISSLLMMLFGYCLILRKTMTTYNYTIDRNITNNDLITVHSLDLLCREVRNVSLFDINITQKAQEPAINNGTHYQIIILTPLKFNGDVDYLRRYVKQLCSLTYPHKNISVALGVDGHKRWENYQDLEQKGKKSFGNFEIFTLRTPKGNWTKSTKHLKRIQLQRRSYLAMARNNLLFRGLKLHHDWILWMDSDLSYIPPNLIQLLLSVNQSIVVPACMYLHKDAHRSESYRIYDKNTWRDTAKSRQYVTEQNRKLGDQFLMLEGYPDTQYRKYLTDLTDQGPVVSVDGVGGCTLLINASCHRNGLIFPPFVFDSHIETEGLAKMAEKMGIPMFGLPFVKVIHL